MTLGDLGALKKKCRRSGYIFAYFAQFFAPRVDAFTMTQRLYEEAREYFTIALERMRTVVKMQFNLLFDLNLNYIPADAPLQHQHTIQAIIILPSRVRFSFSNSFAPTFTEGTRYSEYRSLFDARRGIARFNGVAPRARGIELRMGRF